MKLKTTKGMTLVEILIATLVFSLALGALLNCLVVIVDLIDISKDKTVAVSDLKNIFERMRATPFDSITTRFVNGVVDGPGINLYPNITGSYTLRNEHITVTYPNPNADPLEIKIMAAWLSKKGRAFNTSLSSFRTR